MWQNKTKLLLLILSTLGYLDMLFFQYCNGSEYLLIQLSVIESSLIKFYRIISLSQDVHSDVLLRSR